MVITMNKENKPPTPVIRSSAAEYLIFVAVTGGSQDAIEMRYEDENIWLTQKMMAQLYDVDIRNEHIQNIYAYSELKKEETIRKFRIVQTEGSRQVRREVMHYNLQIVSPSVLRSTMTVPCNSASRRTAF